MTERSWISKGACKGQSHLFFAPRNERQAGRDARERRAKQVCQLCPYIDPCGALADQDPEAYVDLVMGGRSYSERVAHPSRTSATHSGVMSKRASR